MILLLHHSSGVPDKSEIIAHPPSNPVMIRLGFVLGGQPTIGKKPSKKSIKIKSPAITTVNLFKVK